MISSKKSVYLLEHTRNGDESTFKIVGIYSTEREAELAISRVINMPGFCDHPDGFHIDRYTLDEDNWSEGFVDL